MARLNTGWPHLGLGKSFGVPVEMHFEF